MSKTPLEIRCLTVGDRVRLTDMIKKLAETEGDDSLLNVITSQISEKSNDGNGEETEEKDKRSLEVGVSIIKKLLGVIEHEMHSWFADLLGVTPEEFLKLPINTEASVILQIVESEEASDFFTTASRLLNMTEKLKNWLDGVKKKFGIGDGSQESNSSS